MTPDRIAPDGSMPLTARATPRRLVLVLAVLALFEAAVLVAAVVVLCTKHRSQS